MPFHRALKLCTLLAIATITLTASAQRWSEQKANDWYAQQPWLVGSNYIPSNAINQLEMFQPTTFDPAINDRELGYAEGIGMNVMRVFLQDQLWQQDPDGFKQRLDTFLGIAAKHHIRILFVLFDSCWDPNPKLGPQHPPIPGVHNSGWVQSPGVPRLLDRSIEPQFKAYTIGVISAFANDNRVLGWDLWNEPSNDGGGDNTRNPAAVKAKFDRVAELLPQVFAWARTAHPTQPLTSGVWNGNWHDPAKEDAITKIQLRESDIITFHSYGWPEEFEARVHELEPNHRPILCSEYMARGAGSTFDGTLPVAKRLHVAAINWGLVDGKTQTRYPWDSWQRPYVLEQPPIWFHEVFHPDGTPYRQAEADLIRRLTGRGTPLTN
jgi:Cellulase (glycosyl hydrolase family 5)